MKNLELIDVSRETKFSDYEQLIRVWNRQTKLIQENTLNEFMIRHIQDSIQIYPLVKNYKNIVDMGTGAGFPGMALAIMGVNSMTLIESSHHKTFFLQEVARKLNVDVTILHERMEDVQLPDCTLIVARAVTSLNQLLTYSHGICPTAECMFHKGQDTLEHELKDAHTQWDLKYDIYQSATHEKGRIIHIHSKQKLA